MRGLGIKRKLMILALLPGSVISIALYAYFMSAQIGQMNASLLQRGATIARNLAPTSEYGVVTGNTMLLVGQANAILAGNDIDGIAIMDASGKALLKVGQFQLYEREEVPAKRTAVSVCRQNDRAILFCAPIHQSRLPINDYSDQPDTDSVPVAPIGWVFVEMSKAELNARRLEAISQSLVITLVLLSLAGVVAWRIGSAISSPILALTEAVGRVEKGELDTHIEVNAESEIRTLQIGIGAMITAMRVGRDNLKAEVTEATRRLRETLQELEQKNRDLQLQRHQAEDASKAKSEFLATMSHEMRTPISGIVGMLALLEDTALTTAQRDYVKNLGLATKALRALIDDVLDLSRIEAGKMKIVRQTFDPQTIIDETVVMLAPSAHEKGLEFICQVPPEFPAHVQGDPMRLRQVLLNLLSNAIKFTNTGEVRLQVRFAPIGGSRVMARFEVEDTGVGIAEADLPLIFDSFTQADTSSSRSREGSGLGTTIAKALVELMGGHIGVESTPEKGSRFWFELPWETLHAGRRAYPGSHLVSGRRALLLESNRHACEALREYGRVLGLTVECVESPEGLMQRLHEQSYDLVFLAENTRAAARPGIARQLREQYGAALLLCHMTFFQTRSDSTLFDAYMAKPVTLGSLYDCLRRLFEHLPPAAAGTPEAPAVDASGPRILLAEDNAINARVVRSFLEKGGFRVVHVRDGRQALKELAKGDIAAAVLDIRMPQFDGIEVIGRYRAGEAAGEHLPAIGLSANYSEEDRRNCLQAGMDAFLAKPVTAEQLLETLAGLLDG